MSSSGPFSIGGVPDVYAAAAKPVLRPSMVPSEAYLAKAFEKREAEKKANDIPVPPQPTREYEGSLKSLSQRHGYGFIACEEVRRVYGRDVYLPQDIVPAGAKVLDRLAFKIILSAKGHPQA